MKILDWVAILGALAWLPHLIVFLKKYFTKAEVRIITQKSADVGFTTFGPIFNIRMAFSVKNHDLVISNFKTKITHENGEMQEFSWQGIKQQVLRMNTTAGSIPYEKENTVLALKLNQKEIEERLIQCQLNSFLSQKTELENEALSKLSHEMSQNSDYDSANLITTQEASSLFSFIKQSFSWKPGKYTVEFEIESPEKYTLIGNKLNFTLSSLDVERLDKNKEKIEQDYLNLIIPEDHEKRKNVLWNWTNPKLTTET